MIIFASIPIYPGARYAGSYWCRIRQFSIKAHRIYLGGYVMRIDRELAIIRIWYTTIMRKGKIRNYHFQNLLVKSIICGVNWIYSCLVLAWLFNNDIRNFQSVLLKFSSSSPQQPNTTTISLPRFLLSSRRAFGLKQTNNNSRRICSEIIESVFAVVLFRWRIRLPAIVHMPARVRMYSHYISAHRLRRKSNLLQTDMHIGRKIYRYFLERNRFIFEMK